MPTILDGVEPADLGLPSQFKKYRDIQREIVEFCLYGPNSDGDVRRFMACGAPGGSGKSASAHTIAALCGVKTVILTATRALEDQQTLIDKFDCVNVRGKANYLCADYEPLHPETRWMCDEGPDKGCRLAETNFCTYVNKVQEAKEATVPTLSNVSYWLHARGHNPTALETKKSPIGMLIVDEAHLIMPALSSFLGTWVANSDLHKYADQAVREVVRSTRGAESGRLDPNWTAALGKVIIGVWGRMHEIARGYQSEAAAARSNKEYRTLDKLSGNISRILAHAEGEADENDRKQKQPNWLWRMTRNGVSFDCIWPARYAERYLWSGVPRVVLMSATLRPKALGLCGVRLSESYFREWPSVFPVNDWPVYWVPTGRMGEKHKDKMGLSRDRVDEICDEWQGYKGIIHTTSYPNAEWYQANCRWGRHMILNKPGEQVTAMERYKKAKAPCLLVSPSFTTGFDFPEEDMGFQIIPKLPFPDRSDPVMIARCEDDRDYYTYVTANALVQSCLRKMRRPGQKSVTIITDDSVDRFRNYAREHMPRYMKVRDSKEVPRAPGRVEG